MRTRGALALVALVLSVACGGGSSSSEGTPTPAATVTFTVSGPGPTQTAPPNEGPRSVFGEAPVGEWAFGEPGALPPGLAVYYYHGGYATEGGPGPSHRALRLADGTVDIARLRPVVPESERPAEYGEFSMAADSDFRTAFVGACVRGNCGYFGNAEANSEAVIYRSVDGGLSWELFGELERDWWVVGARDRNTAILRHFEPDGTAEQWRLYPGGEPYEPVIDSEYPREIEGWGNAFLVGSDIEGNRYVEYRLSDPNNLWHYLAKVAPDGKVIRAWEWEVTEFARFVGVAAPDLVIGSVLVDERTDAEDGRFYHVEVALLDMETGLAHVIPELSEGLRGNSHPWVTQVVQDNYLVVDAPLSCLNLRAAPTVTGRIIECYADRVLMRDLQESATAEGSEWLRVEAPDGTVGWAVARFLLR